MSLQQWCAQPAGSQPWYVEAAMAPYTLLCPFQPGFYSEAAEGVANAYQQVQYGTPPPVVPAAAPSVTLPVPASQRNAQYLGTDAVGNPVYGALSTASDNQAATVSAQNAAIDAAIAGGYDPAGKLPFNAIDWTAFWSKYGTTLIAGGAVLGGLVLYGAVKR